MAVINALKIFIKASNLKAVRLVARQPKRYADFLSPSSEWPQAAAAMKGMPAGRVSQEKSGLGCGEFRFDNPQRAAGSTI
jgi:hypothetical protein